MHRGLKMPQRLKSILKKNFNGADPKQGPVEWKGKFKKKLILVFKPKWNFFHVLAHCAMSGIIYLNDTSYIKVLWITS